MRISVPSDEGDPSPSCGPTQRRSRPAVVARAGAGVLSFAVLVASGVCGYAYHSLSSGLLTSNALNAIRHDSPSHLDNSVNLLLVGLDSRKDMNGDDLPKQFVADELHAGSSGIGGYNTNTLILMHVPSNGGKVTAFSVPRDDYVETFNGDGSSQGYHKIKEAYGLAKAAAETRLRVQGVTDPAQLEQQSREVGREATLVTVQQFLGVPVDHFAEVNLLGFYDIAKVLQPIQVCLKRPVSDPAIDGQGSGANFHVGLNTIDAEQALSFVRQRHNLAGGDLDRTARQQAFIASVTHKLETDGVLSDVARMRALFDVVKKDVVLDRGWNVLDFARQAPNLTGGHVVFHTLPVERFGNRRGESVNLVDPVLIKSLMRTMTLGAAASPVSPPAQTFAEVTAPAPGTMSAPASGSASSRPAAGAGGQFYGAPVEMGGIPCVE